MASIGKATECLGFVRCFGVRELTEDPRQDGMWWQARRRPVASFAKTGLQLRAVARNVTTYTTQYRHYFPSYYWKENFEWSVIAAKLKRFCL